MKLPDEFPWRRTLSSNPGVYAFVHKGEVIYVGKAQYIANRCRSHFASVWFKILYEDEVKPAFYWFPCQEPDASARVKELIEYCQPIGNRRKPRKEPKSPQRIPSEEIKPIENQPHLKVLREYYPVKWIQKRPMKRRKAKIVTSNHGS